MKRKTKVILLILIIFILILIAAMILPALRMSKKSKLLISCSNHLMQIEFLIYSQFKNSDGLIQLPYDKNLPGYAVIAKVNIGLQGFNCNQGAPHHCCGGWQYLNLPMDTLYNLNTEWKKKYPSNGMPIIWCGKGDLQYRRTLSLMSIEKQEKGINVSLFSKSINYNEYEYLNECLQKIGENPISFDVPDGIDWDQYLKKEIESKSD